MHSLPNLKSKKFNFITSSCTMSTKNAKKESLSDLIKETKFDRNLTLNQLVLLR